MKSNIFAFLAVTVALKFEIYDFAICDGVA